MTNQKGNWILIILMSASMVMGIFLGVRIGDKTCEDRTVFDNDHLIYDSVLYKQVIPDE